MRHTSPRDSGSTPHALSLYIAAPGAYLAPLVAIVLYRADGLRHVGVGFAASVFVLLFPVQPSIAQTREGAFTVGLIHRELTLLLPPLVGDATFWPMAAAWLAAMTTALKQAAVLRSQEWRTLSHLFPWAGVTCFLVVMPFSYMPWEKYALPLLMLTSVILARDIRDREASTLR